MSDVTAVVLSAAPAEVAAPGCEVLVHVSQFNTAAGLQAARFNAAAKVRTSHFFYLDDDDELTPQFPALLQQCMAAGVPLAYTDELIRTPLGERTRTGQPYSQAAHLADMMLVHHLALCRTEDTVRAIERLPRGHFGVEPMLYWELAKGGAAYVPGVPYVWNAREGLHRRTEIRASMHASQHWAGSHP